MSITIVGEDTDWLKNWFAAVENEYEHEKRIHNLHIDEEDLEKCYVVVLQKIVSSDEIEMTKKD